jgi:hypothetical protein
MASGGDGPRPWCAVQPETELKLTRDWILYEPAETPIECHRVQVLHENHDHIMSNMALFMVLSYFMEQKYGTTRVTLIAFIAGVGGNFFRCARHTAHRCIRLVYDISYYPLVRCPQRLPLSRCAMWHGTRERLGGFASKARALSGGGGVRGFG